MSWYSRCSWCGGPFNGEDCRRCTNKKVNIVNDVLASGVDINLEKDLAGFVLQATNISTHTPEPLRHFKYFYDDYEESTNPLPPSILITTSPPVLPIEDPEDSFIMRDEDLSTILEKESVEVIKSSVENLVQIPSCYLKILDSSISKHPINKPNKHANHKPKTKESTKEMNDTNTQRW
nr:hypothetical protein [Tanacetum cinerariifolium]